jgi:hypothetical protein
MALIARGEGSGTGDAVRTKSAGVASSIDAAPAAREELN